MELLEIRKVPDPVLREEAVFLDRVTLSERELLDDMEYTMSQSGGIGLAAPQVGITKALIVALDSKGRVFKIVNPVVVKSSGFDTMVEGCLSIPEQSVEIERSYRVIIEGLDQENRVLKLRAKGLFARVLQHEVDHLKGRLITDYRR
jgi:peptide deformylase